MDFYQVLGVDKKDTSIEIKKKYLKLAIKYHPDKNKGDDSSEMYGLIQEAWSVLGNEKKRKKYDKEAETKTDHISLKQDFQNFAEISGKEYKKPTEKSRQEFERMKIEMNEKIGYTGADGALSKDDFKKRLGDKSQEREQQEIECTHEKLYDETKQIPADEFNARFEAQFAKANDKIDLYNGGPAPFNFGDSIGGHVMSGTDLASFADINGNDAVIDFSDPGPKHNKNVKVDIEDYKKNKQKYEEKIDIERLIKERQNETQKLSQITLSDFKTSDSCDLLLTMDPDS